MSVSRLSENGLTELLNIFGRKG